MMFKHFSKIEGPIGYYGLSDWWLSVFTDAEREYIESSYNTFDSELGGRSLTQGKFFGSSGTVSQLLWGLSTWFKNPNDYFIADRILTKAEETAEDIIDFHYTYQQMIQIHYRMRDIYPEALNKAILACEKQIKIASDVAKNMKKEYPNTPLPTHVGYTQLAIIFDKQKKYTEALQLVKQAKKQKWAGDWDKRELRYQKKAQKE